MSRVNAAGLDVAEPLHSFVVDEVLPATGLTPEAFWGALADVLADLGPEIAAAIEVRDHFQDQIDAFHRERPGAPDVSEYERFLRDIGYLVEEPPDFTISTRDVDPEVAVVAGPQLVVPVQNARFATNAANARWGSLYDALYGSDVLGPADERGTSYNPVRGAEVIARGRAFLDAHFPLTSISHADVTSYRIRGGALRAEHPAGTDQLAEPDQLVGFAGTEDDVAAILLRHHGLHVEMAIDRSGRVGASDKAGVSDIVLEAAVTTIMDLEDSVAAVDAADKVAAYRNWLRLMRGTLAERVEKNGAKFLRTLNPDREYVDTAGDKIVLPGRSLLFVRQVGHLMTTDIVRDRDGRPCSEGVLDAFVTVACGLHDLRGNTTRRNSRTGSVYAVKPKMHGPAEVALTCEIFARIESAFRLARGTVKLGIMDEERRTSVNLKACIHAARDRVAFINTGFLDRTGDEIHTSMLAGPMVRKADMRSQGWLSAYEDANVRTGLACGFRGRAQIGKGMWAAPDNMAQMVREKIGHPRAGASCAWVPSPTAATLHAMHYHEVDVAERQAQLISTPPPPRTALLEIPLGTPGILSADDVRAELENNLQGALGYVVRWIEMGVGCSKVPDIHGTPLMEDRATCRISTQHVANWLLHGVVSAGEVEHTMVRMAAVVDAQNAGDPGYRPMSTDLGGQAFQAVRDLVFDGRTLPSGYTEPVLHRRRQLEKRRHRDAGR